MKIFLVAGARPNLMKIAPIVRALRARSDCTLDWNVVHTGQHYDYEMSQASAEEQFQIVPVPEVVEIFKEIQEQPEKLTRLSLTGFYPRSRNRQTK
jgi:UDP-N-acetylglucosamine 2-epimerase